MQFWSGTAFMTTSDALAVTRMLDETGFDGMICADHLIYPRTLSSPYPHVLCRDGRADEQFEIMIAPLDVPSWMDTPEEEWGRVGAFRGPIERFAGNVIAKVR